MHFLETEVQQGLKRAGLNSDSPILLACSGGRDSMVLLHLLLSLGYAPAVAHVNFKLRGADSEGDAEHVRQFCAEKNLVFHYKTFDTLEEADAHKESIQMAARRLRYAWLFQLVDECGYHRLLTAHHDRDQAETLLLNLMRGTGPKGMQGMKEDDGRLLRPMLHLPYEEVERYAEKGGIVFREDKSNAQTKYRRNFIRHELMKPWEEAFPGTIRQINRSSEIMLEVNEFLHHQMDALCSAYVKEVNGRLQIDYAIRKESFVRLLMRHLLNPYHLQDQVPFILESVSRPGAMFSSESHVLLADREFWILESRDKRKVNASSENLKALFGEKMTMEWNGFQFKLVREGKGKNQGNHSIRINPGALNQLFLRTWKQGDVMQPFGMKGKKKLSDLLIDAGINRLDKEKIPVLTNEKGDILWLAGIRSSELLRLEEGQEFVELVLFPDLIQKL